MPKRNAVLSIGFLYDDTLDSSDGVAHQVKTLGAWLSQRGHKVSYLVGETKMREWQGGMVYSLARNQAVTFNGNQMSIPLPANRRKIKQLLDDIHFDVLHVQVPYSPFMAKRVINSANESTVVVGTFHVYPSSYWVELGTKFLRLLLGRSLKKFDEMISVSTPTATFAKRTFGINSLVIPNTVDVRHFKLSTHTRSNRQAKQIVFLGRLVERKGCLYLLKAFKELLRNVPEAKLIIAGDGPRRKMLEIYVKQQKIDRSVDFLGFISEADKPKLLAQADIACFPSLYGEAFGIVLIEAMAAGAGIVMGGNNPGYLSVLGEQRELLIDPKKTAAFAAQLEKLLKDEGLIARLHKWQTKQIKNYDIAVVGPMIESTYYRTVANR